MENISEEFVSGFCKNQNQTRTVLCEFEVAADGSRKLSYADCDYGKCKHSASCTLMGAALENPGKGTCTEQRGTEL